MSSSFNQPQNQDAVLGGQGAMPAGGVVLGGFDGVKRRLASSVAAHRLEALPEALKYGQKGLFLVVRALNDSSSEVHQAAYALLRERPEPRVQQAVRQFYQRSHYTRLESVLSQGKWQEADQETKLALFKACGLTLASQFPNYRIADVPCDDLQIIDRLWRKSSGDRFGFSIQAAIWQPLQNLLWDKTEVWSRFGNRVGWRTTSFLIDRRWKRYDEITFSLSAPVGHLPFLGDEFGIFTVEAIAHRLNICQIG
jgi:hypothetical protein